MGLKLPTLAHAISNLEQVNMVNLIFFHGRISIYGFAVKKKHGSCLLIEFI
jgi:hypothetical protein